MSHDYPVKTENVVYRYDDAEKNAVDSVSLSIEKGSFVAVLGHNGSGKSTYAKLLNALYIPEQGSVVICGNNTSEEEKIWDIRRSAGMVFQNPDNQIVSNIVREDVAFGLENLGVEHDEMVRRIDECLRAVGMEKYADSAPHMLSGGQKQRVAIAGVLAMQPQVMVLDEATAMLDPSGREDVFETVRKLNREKQMTVVWITHYMEEAAMADRVVVFDHGRIAMDGTPSSVFCQVEAIEKLGLEVPPMAALAARLREAGLLIGKDILTVDDMMKELNKHLCLSASNI